MGWKSILWGATAARGGSKTNFEAARVTGWRDLRIFRGLHVLELLVVMVFQLRGAT